MPAFQFRARDDDLIARLGKLEDAHQALVRDHEALCARHERDVEVLMLMAVPEWLREAIDLARSNDFIVTCRSTCVVFDRPEGEEHRRTVKVPLPEDPKLENRLRKEIRGHILLFMTLAA